MLVNGDGVPRDEVLAAMRLELDGAQFRWQAIGTDQTVKHSGMGICHTIAQDK